MAGLAEDAPGVPREESGERIRDNFIVKEANTAGIYAVRLNLNGEPLVVVVDEWFPFYIDHHGNEQFAFSRNKTGSNEMWVQILEKAWAKVCGSYEQSENGTCLEAFNNIDATPCREFYMKDIEKNDLKEYLWDILREAERKRYVVTCDVDSTQRGKPDVIKDFGLCDFHSYSLMKVAAVPLKKDNPRSQKRFMLQLRNPWGTKEWLGPWSDYSKTWERYKYPDEKLRRREDKEDRPVVSAGTLGAADDGRFWITFKDLFYFFNKITVNFTNDKYYVTTLADKGIDEKFGVVRMKIPEKTKMLFVSVFQMNQKFFDPEEDITTNSEEATI